MSSKLSPVIVYKKEQLLQRKKEILDTLNLTAEEYGRKVREDDLSGTEWDYRMEYNSINFLLAVNI